MIVGDIPELKIVDVPERGMPNRERITIRVEENINMGQYGLMLGVQPARDGAIPIRDNLLWFGDAFVLRGDWIFVYTGPGEPRNHEIPNTNERIFVVHWGRSQTIFQSPEIVPILFRIDAVQIPTDVKALSQHSGQDV